MLYEHKRWFHTLKGTRVNLNHFSCAKGKNWKKTYVDKLFKTPTTPQKRTEMWKNILKLYLSNFMITITKFWFHDPIFCFSSCGQDELGRLVGADPNSVILMNSLTVNLHLLMVSFYQPTADRYKIVIENHAFPSDRVRICYLFSLH